MPTPSAHLPPRYAPTPYSMRLARIRGICWIWTGRRHPSGVYFADKVFGSACWKLPPKRNCRTRNIRMDAARTSIALMWTGKAFRGSSRRRIGWRPESCVRRCAFCLAPRGFSSYARGRQARVNRQHALSLNFSPRTRNVAPSPGDDNVPRRLVAPASRRQFFRSPRGAKTPARRKTRIPTAKEMNYPSPIGFNLRNTSKAK
jgi:hypothetical protein